MKRKISFLYSLSIALLCSSAMAQASSGLTDPTKPGRFVTQLAVSTASLVKQFKLHSVLISSQRRVAVINEKSVRVGDSVNGATVQKIEKNRVFLNKQGSQFSLTLTESDFKQRK